MNTLSTQSMPSILPSPPPLVYGYGVRGFYPPFYPLNTESLTERSSPSNIVHTIHSQLANQDMETRRVSQQNQTKYMEKDTDEVKKTRKPNTEKESEKDGHKLSDDDEGKPMNCS